MKKALSLSLLFCFLIPVVSISQTSPCYVITPISYAPDSLTAPTHISLFDDEWSNVISIGFPFCFFGNYYTQCVIGSNGSISFNLGNASGYETWPINSPFPSNNPADLQNSINGPWTEINPGVGGTVTYQTLGVSPYRKFVVEYRDISTFSCTGQLFTAQIMIYESLNTIETHIKNKGVCPTWNHGAAIHGIQNINGTVASVVPGRNGEQWTAVNEGMRWDPVCQCPSQYGGNTISGKVFIDTNNNCVEDAGENGVGSALLRVAETGFLYSTDPNGNYTMHVDTGHYTVSLLPGTYYDQVCPAGNYSIYLPSSPMTFPGADFADTAQHCHDLNVAIDTWQQRICDSNNLNIQVCNIGPQTANNVVLTVTLPDSAYLVSPLNYISNPGPGIYQYSLGNLSPNQCIYFPVIDSIDCNAIAHSVFCFQASVSADSLDCFIENNHDMECHQVTSPYDPNTKLVASQQFENLGYVTQEYIAPTDTLTYEIQFQNTGTDTAINVSIVDTISGYLDAGMIRLIGSSHPCTMTVFGDVAVFSFNHIMLPDSNADERGSHGIVKYKIVQRPGNMPGTIIHNSAAIYFDINLPVITNQTENIIQSGVAGIHKLNISVFKVYPNPATSSLTIESNLPIDNITIQSIDGRKVKSIPGNQLSVISFVVEDLSAGIYFIEVNKNSRQRFVKQ
jgi:uncharacterized repeat protein (TIGR01451 family)